MHSSDPAQSALVVPVPELEPAVGRHRDRYDPAASWGVPAHATVLYPFVPPARVDAAVLAAAAAAVASVPGFDLTFSRCRWFDDTVLWVEPEPAEPLAALTATVTAAFPDYRPYGGTYEVVVPHVTVGLAEVGGLAGLRAAERAVIDALPVVARVRAVVLMTGSPAPATWKAVTAFPLGAR